MKKTNLTIAMLSIVTTGILSGCGESGDEKPATQVIAKINNDEITIHQLNFELSRQRAVKQDDVKEIGKPILDQLVNQQLLIQKAIEHELDRKPQVMQRIERTKRLILAQAYAQKLFGAIVPPTQSDIAEYFEANPEKFAERKTYQFQEILIGKKYSEEELHTELRNAESLKAFAETLRSNDVPLRISTSVKSIEQLPPEVLNKVMQMSQGDAATFVSPEGALVLHLAGVKNEPLSLDEASPSIKRYLVEQQQKKMIADEVERLRNNASIEFMGMFSDAEGENASSLAVPKDVAGEEENNDDLTTKDMNPDF